MISLIDAASAPGREGRANEDAYGVSGDCAWVFDGATGVAETPLLPGDSDAAWLARVGSELLTRHALTHDGDAASMVRVVLEEISARFEAEKLRDPAARYERPTAALILLRLREGVIEAVNFGDCRLLVLFDDGRFEMFGSDPRAEEYERTGAARYAEHRRRNNAGVPEIARPSVLEKLRQVRALHNTPGAYWVFGLDPEAADHLRMVSLPLAGQAHALLASDGFLALATDYGRYDPPGLVAAAREKGLSVLMNELRHIERVEDPDAMTYPRFKQSDDATAVLLRLEVA
jgi:serine/threonine protein phosphatase PrpC